MIMSFKVYRSTCDIGSKGHLCKVNGYSYKNEARVALSNLGRGRVSRATNLIQISEPNSDFMTAVFVCGPVTL